jgi:hypothetical protein
MLGGTQIISTLAKRLGATELLGSTDLAKGSGVQLKQAVRTLSEMALSTTTGAPMQRNSTGTAKVEAMIMASAVVECIFFIKKKSLELHLWNFYGK